MFVFLSKFLPLFVYPLGLACLLLIAALIFQRRARLRNILIVLAVMILWIGSNRWVASALIRSLEWQYLPLANIPPADAIVVLGGGTDAPEYPRPSVELNGAGDRVLYAARLYKEGKAPHILLSGGYITWMGSKATTPAQDMAEILGVMGIPQEALWLQGASQNTHEDALYSSQMLKEKGIRRVILVTSAIHMPRAVPLFQHEGIEVIPAPTDYSITQAEWQDLTRGSLAEQLINLMPNSSYLRSTSTALKEYLGMFVYRLAGWSTGG